MIKKKIHWNVLWFSALILSLILISITVDYGLKLSLPLPFAVIPLVIAGGYVCYSTFDAIRSLHKITAGMLVVLALIGTTWVGEYLSGAIVAFMMIFGEALEELTMEKTRNAVRDLIRLVPSVCRKKVDGVFKEVSIKTVRPGDILQVIPGERIPVDGRIIAGEASVNEASITGESLPVDKQTGDSVYVGSFNENGVMEICTEKIGNDTVLGRIVKTVHTAQENKGRSQRIADRFSNYFLPVVLVICAVTGLITRDYMRVMSILVIACPCALVLATPTAVIASVGNAAKKGVLLKGGNVIEESAKITALCLDKTGTLTKGKPGIIAEKITGSEADFYEAMGIAEKNSQHPIGKAIVHYLTEEKKIDVEQLPDAAFHMVFGRGVRAEYEGVVYEVSNYKVLEDMKEIKDELLAFRKEQEDMGRTVLFVCKDRQVEGVLAVADTIRENVPAAIKRLKKAGISRIVMLTGDNESTAKTICWEAGIEEFHANLLPDEKLDYLRQLQQSGEKVAMVGDGVNDAPALALADIGIAMGAAGTDVAVETADIALMADNIGMLPFIFNLSKKTYGIIKQNIIIFACLVNICGIALSGLGFLNPVAAAVIHNASSIFVVLNSSRMLVWKD